MDPTEPWRELLDPEGAKAAAAADIAIACPMLRELVNYGSRVWGLCASQMPEGLDEGIAPARLYYHVLEMVDAIEVLLREASAHSTKLILRSEWEAYLQLAFLLRQTTRYRDATLAWVVGASRQKLKELREILKMAEREPADEHLVVSQLARNRIARMESGLAKPHLAAVSGWATDPWYRAFGGGISIEQLAATLGRLEKEQDAGQPIRQDVAYITFYRFGSSMVHASDYDRVMSRSKDGDGGNMEPIRGSGAEALNVASPAASVALAATRMMIARFAADRTAELADWYRQSIQASYMKISTEPRE